MARLFDVWSARHESRQVDLAFVVDSTQSMGSYIVQTQSHIQNITRGVRRAAFDVRLALIGYRDHPPQDTTYVSRCHDFTTSVIEMQGWVDGLSAAGGGDTPDAVADGLHEALNLTYRPRATKICVWIGDAQPHGLHPDHDDEIPDGCPSNHDPVQICHEMAAKGIILCCVGCEPTLRPYRDFFMGLSLITGGQYIPLEHADCLPRIIVHLTREEIQNENLMGHVEDHIHLERVTNGITSVDQLADSLHTVLQLNNNRAISMRINRRQVEPLTPLARQISSMHTLPEAAAAIQNVLQIENARPEEGIAVMRDLDEAASRRCLRLIIRSSAREPVVIEMV